MAKTIKQLTDEELQGQLAKYQRLHQEAPADPKAKQILDALLQESRARQAAAAPPAPQTPQPPAPAPKPAAPSQAQAKVPSGRQPAAAPVPAPAKQPSGKRPALKISGKQAAVPAPDPGADTVAAELPSQSGRHVRVGAVDSKTSGKLKLAGGTSSGKLPKPSASLSGKFRQSMSGSGITQTSRRMPLEKKKKGPLYWAVVAGVAVLVLGGGTGLWWISRDPQDVGEKIAAFATKGGIPLTFGTSTYRIQHDKGLVTLEKPALRLAEGWTLRAGSLQVQTGVKLYHAMFKPSEMTEFIGADDEVNGMKASATDLVLEGPGCALKAAGAEIKFAGRIRGCAPETMTRLEVVVRGVEGEVLGGPAGATSVTLKFKGDLRKEVIQSGNWYPFTNNGQAVELAVESLKGPLALIPQPARPVQALLGADSLSASSLNVSLANERLTSSFTLTMNTDKANLRLNLNLNKDVRDREKFEYLSYPVKGSSIFSASKLEPAALAIVKDLAAATGLPVVVDEKYKSGDLELQGTLKDVMARLGLYMSGLEKAAGLAPAAAAPPAEAAKVEAPKEDAKPDAPAAPEAAPAADAPAEPPPAQ